MPVNKNIADFYDSEVAEKGYFKNADEFKTFISNPENAKEFYDSELKDKGYFNTPDEFKSFLGVKSQPAVQQPPNTDFIQQPHDFLTGTTPAGTTPQEPKDNRPSIDGIHYSEDTSLIAPAIKGEKTENQKLQDYGKGVTKAITAKKDEAIANTIERKNSMAGLTTDKKSVKYKKEFNSLKQKEASGDIVLTEAKDGKPFMVRGSGFLESSGTAFLNSLKAIPESWKINMIADPKNLADILDQKQRDAPYLPESEPSGLGGAFGEAAGAFPKIAGMFAIPVVGTGVAVFETEMESMAAKREELYHRGMQEGKEREQAAADAIKDAPLAAAPDALMMAALGAETSKLKVAAKTFKDASLQAGKSITKMGGMGGTAGLAKAGIEKAQGYDITTDEAMKMFGEEGFQYATLDAMFKIAPIIAKMPGFMQAAAKEYFANVPKPLFEEATASMGEEGIKLKEEVTKYEEARKTVEAVVAPEDMPVFAGLVEKKQALEKKKEGVDKAFHPEIDKDIEAINQKIEVAKNSDNPAKVEADDLTGEHNLNVKLHEDLTKAERDGIEVPTEYGGVDVVQKGEGENKTFVPKAWNVEKKGALGIRKPIKIEGEFKDKAKAKEAAEAALKQHFYENGLADNLKPEKKEVPVESGEITLTKDLEATKVRADENHSTYKVKDKYGNEIGNISFNYREDLEGYQIENVKIDTPNKGIGTKVYRTLIEKLDKPLISDSARTPAVEAVWKKLEKEGIAKFDEKTGKYFSIKQDESKVINQETNQDNKQGNKPPEETLIADATVDKGKQAAEDFTAKEGNKVVDENGEPLTVYHGTESGGKILNAKAKETTGNPTSGWGIFFAPEKREAQRIIDAFHGKKGDVIEANVNLKNPYEMSFKEYDDFVKLDLSQKEKSVDEQAKDNKVRADEFKKKLLEDGYDGIIIGKTGKARSQEIVAFDKSQIKETSKPDATVSEVKQEPAKEEKQIVREEVPKTINEIVDKLHNPKEGITGEESERLKSKFGLLAEVALAKNKKEKWGILASHGSITNLQSSLKSLLFDINKLSKGKFTAQQFEEIATKYSESKGDYLHKKPVSEEVIPSIEVKSENAFDKNGKVIIDEKKDFSEGQPYLAGTTVTEYGAAKDLSPIEKIQWALWRRGQIQEQLGNKRGEKTNDKGVQWANKNAQTLKSGAVKELLAQRKVLDEYIKKQLPNNYDTKLGDFPKYTDAEKNKLVEEGVLPKYARDKWSEKPTEIPSIEVKKEETKPFIVKKEEKQISEQVKTKQDVSTQIEKQQQAGDKPSNKPEHARTGEESKGAQPRTDGGDSNIGGKGEATQKEKGIALHGKELANLLRKSLKSKGDTLETNIFGIPIAIKDGLVELVATAIENGAELAEAIQKAVATLEKRYRDKFDEKGFTKAIEDVSAGEKPKVRVDTKPEPSKSIGIKHAATEEIRAELELGDYERNNPSDKVLEARADAEIKAGYDHEKLIQKLENLDAPSGVENFILKKYLSVLKAKVDANPTDANIDAIHRVVKALDKIGSLQSEAFRTRKGFEAVDDSLAGFFIREKESAGVDVLTEGQKAKVQKEFDDIKAAHDALMAKIAKAEAENVRLQAELVLKKERSSKTSSGTKKTHSDYVKDREKIIENIRKKLREARGDTTATIVPYAKELFAIAPDVSKLFGSLVEEGFDKLGDIVKEIHSTLKDSIDDITEKDVHDIIAGVYTEKKKTRSELAIKLRDLRDEAKMVNRLEALNGVPEPKAEKEKILRNKEITALQLKIKEHDATKLTTIRNRTLAEIKKVEADLKTGNFLKEKVKPPTVKLDKETLALKDQLIKLKQDREIRLLRQKYADRSKFEKGVDIATEIANVPRAIMASMDFSAPLRQGLIPTISHPSLAIPAGREMFRQAFSQKAFDRWFFDIKDHPRYELAKDSKLYLSDPHDLKLSAKEEQYMTNIAEKIPVIGRFIKGSERAYLGYLNKMRWDLFNRYVDAFEADGKTFENNPKLYKAIGEYINATTGRGGLGKFEESAQVLNAVFFSPRLIASRLQLLTNAVSPKFWFQTPKEIRVEYLNDMTKFIGVGLTTLALAKLMGADVEDDPRSTDFGKIKVGDTRYDIWGGFQTYVRMLAQVFSGKRKSTSTGVVQTLKPKDKWDLMTSFARGKLAPIWATGIDIGTGADYIGQPVTIAGEIEKTLLPMLYSDIKDVYKDNGVKSIFTVGVPATFGIGVQTYKGRAGALSKEDAEKPEWKFWQDKELTFVPASKNQYDVPVDDKHPDGNMTDEEFETFAKEWKKSIESDTKTFMENGAYKITTTDKDGDVHVRWRIDLPDKLDQNETYEQVDAKDLTDVDLKGLHKFMSGKATKQAKD